MKKKLFGKILVANRGEIAIRVMRACRELGIPTAAVYSDADRNAIHVRYADEAHHIGGAPPTESYLQLERIVKVAHDCGADAIHPGYGFLSEKPAFPDACEKAGIRFIGPPGSAMRALSSKVETARSSAMWVAEVVPVRVTIPACWAKRKITCAAVFLTGGDGAKLPRPDRVELAGAPNTPGSGVGAGLHDASVSHTGDWVTACGKHGSAGVHVCAS